MVATLVYLMILFSPDAAAFAPSHHVTGSQRGYSLQRHSSQDDDAHEEEIRIDQSTVRIDDGGSDLTDRFKYKVNALMGCFDPESADLDNERQDGNILNAMLKFPVRYKFHVVGKTTEDGQSSSVDVFEQAVKSVVTSEIPFVEGDDQEIVCEITPRGKKFTKITIEVSVPDAATITKVYDKLEALEQCVMKF